VVKSLAGDENLQCLETIQRHLQESSKKTVCGLAPERVRAVESGQKGGENENPVNKRFNA
jgi:hypothetical protein